LETDPLNFKRLISNRLYNEKNDRRDSHSSSDFSYENSWTSKDKAHDLTSRILMSPSLGKMIKSHGLEKKAMELKRSSSFSTHNPEVFEANREKPDMEQLKLILLPFNPNMLNYLPKPLLERLTAQKRKWRGEDALVLIKQVSYGYRDVFAILAVDDNDFILETLDKISNNYVRNIDRAKTGLEAYNKYLAGIEQGLMYHLILMDLQMPTWDGYEATAAIREYEVKKKVPRSYICALSGNEQKSVEDKCMACGMDYFLTKPMAQETMNNLIETRCRELGIEPKLH